MRRENVTIGPRLLDASIGKIVQLVQYHSTKTIVKRIFSPGSLVPEDVITVKSN